MVGIRLFPFWGVSAYFQGRFADLLAAVAFSPSKSSTQPLQEVYDKTKVPIDRPRYIPIDKTKVPIDKTNVPIDRPMYQLILGEYDIYE